MSSSVNEHHNIIWSYDTGGTWQCSAGPGSKVATCTYGSSPTLFESGFFASPVDYSVNHNKTLDFHPAAGSPAANAGDANDQPPFEQGSLDPSGFILRDGVARDAVHHSAGAYEP